MTAERRLDIHEDRIGDLEDEVFGNEEKKIPGLKAHAQRAHDIIERARGVIWFMGFVGFTNLVAIIWLAATV